MDIVLGFLGFLTGLLICVVAFMVALPIYGSVGLFVNKPGEATKSGFHLFTKLEPGQVKAIVRGDKLVRMITNTAGKRFARKSKDPNTEYDSADYWELIDGKTENPVADVWEPIRGWAQYVYEKTGLVFTGIYPFQRVREYTLERTKVNRSEVGREQATGKSNLVLEVDTDISDHYRTREFLFPMHITGAESKDKIPLDIIGVAEMEVVNAYKAAFGTDRWDQKMINLVTDAINAKTKTLSLDEVLTADSGGAALAIQQAATGITEDTKVCGIEIKGFKILEINPVLDPEGLKAIQAEAIALQKAKATRIDGKARADALSEINKANAAGGEHSIATMEAEALVRAAEAAGRNGSVFLMPGGNRGGADPTQAAILAELKKLNERSRA
jgi:regulator of protease activity HflC (stomatin/prohibitin superfamily)